MRQLAFLALAIIALAFGAMNANGAHAADLAADTSIELATGPSLLDVWQLHSVLGIETSMPATLLVSADLRASGKAPCNSYFASVELGEGTIVFGAIAATRMACSVRIVSAEEAYFGALERVRSYVVESNTLTLKDASGVTILSYERAAA